MIHCLWSHSAPPEFCTAWAVDLDTASSDDTLLRPADVLTEICLDYACVLHRIKTYDMDATDGVRAIDRLDGRMAQWAVDTPRSDKRWSYHNIQVGHSSHVWNRTIHAYFGMPVPGAWNSYRSARLMMLRTRENLRQLVDFSDADHIQQQSELRDKRRQLVDEICACIPVQLGHAKPAYSSGCVLISSYTSIWPLFFAGQCVLEWAHQESWSLRPRGIENLHAPGILYLTANMQLQWIRSRFDFIARNVGLRWAIGVATLLREDSDKHSILS